MVLSALIMVLMAFGFGLITILFFVIPSNIFLTGNLDVASIASLISKASIFVPGEMIFLLITSVVFWTTAHIVWAIIEWIYKKIPGVN